MTDTDTDTAIAHLPRPPLRHVFGAEMRLAPEVSPSGCEQVERTCANCGVVKITIIDAADNHRRAWRRGGEQVETYVAPMCEGTLGT